MIKGNHEQMMYDDLGPVAEFGAKRLWLSNGGGCTRREMLYHIRSEDRRRIPAFLLIASRNSWILRLTGSPSTLSMASRGWILKPVSGAGSNPTRENPIPGTTVIVGHTPTCFLTNDFESPFRIWKRPGIIDIDCGCGNETDKRALACLRLNDMKEFYC